MFLKRNKNKGNIYAVYLRIGYKKDEVNKNKLTVDENVVHVVRKIFEMYANGAGSKLIVKYLNDNHFLSPSGYRKKGFVQEENTNFMWNETTVCNMLKNEVYIGNTIQNKVSVVSYKVKKLRKVEKEKHIRVNNTHDAIIDKDVFEKVNIILEKRGANTKFKYDYLLRGLIYCYHCKRKLQIVLKNNSKRNSVAHPYITCSDHKSRGCYPLNINYEKFEKDILYIVKKTIQTHANKEIFYSAYEKYKSKKLNMEEGLSKKLILLDKTIYEINNNLDKMYMDKLKGVLLEEDYVRYSQKFIFERKNLIAEKEKLKQKLTKTEELNNMKSKIKTEKELDELINDFLKLEQIDKMCLYRLINRIEIDKDKNVYIYFNFSKPNSMNENLAEFIKIEEIINK